jgi:hypothetical protein
MPPLHLPLVAFTQSLCLLKSKYNDFELRNTHEQEDLGFQTAIHHLRARQAHLELQADPRAPIRILIYLLLRKSWDLLVLLNITYVYRSASHAPLPNVGRAKP